jgi:hypothetical protein
MKCLFCEKDAILGDWLCSACRKRQEQRNAADEASRDKGPIKNQ